jgi:UDP-glucose 4-epimerase
VHYLITGGAGFIGSHLTDALVDRGDTVSVLDNLSTGRLANVEHLADHPAVFLHEGSILDEHVVGKLVPDSDVVVHLAASVGVHLIVERPLESLINNIKGTEIVLEACATHERKVLVASTSEIYGKNSAGALHEDSDRILGSPFKARWSYSTAKAVDEILAYNYWRVHGMPSIVVRLFNCVGPRQTGAYGMVVPRFVRQALLDENITVYGDGSQQRSFCHVQDTVAALMLLLDEPKAIGDVFNIGAPYEITMDALAETIVSMTGSRSEIVHTPYDVVYEEGFEDMERRLPDISKIGSLVGWKPTRSLDDILVDVIGHERATLGAAPGIDGKR